MKDCIFCQIGEGELPAQIVFEDEKIVAFKDINPKAPTHLLIIPKKHIENLNNLTPKDATLVGQLIITAVDLAQKLKISQTGYRLVFNSGSHSGQIIDHIHLHLLGGGPLKGMA